MKYRKLGRTGFEVSDIAHGLWGMSGWSGSERPGIFDVDATGGRSRLQFLRHGLGLWRRQKRRPARRHHAEKLGKAALRGVENSSRRICAGRRSPTYKYSDVFSAKHVFNMPT